MFDNIRPLCITAAEVSSHEDSIAKMMISLSGVLTGINFSTKLRSIKKGLKIASRAGGYLLQLVLLLIIVVAYAIRTEAFQTWLAQKAAAYLSEELHTEVSIDRLNVHFFDNVVFENLFLNDLQGDTLIFAEEFECQINYIDIDHAYLQIESLQLNNGRVKLQKYTGEPSTNIQFLVDYFSSEDTTSTKWLIENGLVKLNGTHFSYKDWNFTDTVSGMNFRNIDAAYLDLEISEFEIVRDTVAGHLHHLSVIEQSGFRMDSMSGHIRFAPDGFGVTDMAMVTPNSKLYTDLSFEYDSLSAFQDFIHAVEFRSDADSVDIGFRDLAYFAPVFADLDKSVHLEGTIKGTVDHLKGRNMLIQVAENSYFDGRFDLNGLPAIAETSITIMVNDLTTNSEELIAFLDPIVDPAAFEPARAYMDRAGQFSFNGSFMGFTNDFVAYGQYLTDLGEFDTDISFSQDTSGAFEADGRVFTKDFNIGGLIANREFGAVTCDFVVTADGKDFDHAKARIDGGVSAFYAHGYNYENTIVLGDVTKEYFSGTVFVRDDNIDANFAGLVDFRNKIPKFDFEGDIQNANLEKLNFLDESHKSSSLCLAYKADAEGNSIDNLIGNITLTGVEYYENDQEYSFGDIIINSEYYGDIKSLYVETDMFDASITGDFKIDELPTNMRSLLAEIIPSFDTDWNPERTYDQSFDFEIITEDLTMVSDLLMPSLSITPYSYIYGNFNSTRMDFGLSGIINDFEIYDYEMHGFAFNVEKNSDVVTVMVEADELFVTDSISFQEFLVGAKARQDGIETWMHWNNVDSDSWGKIEGYGNVLGPQEFEFDLWKSEVRLLKKDWILDENAFLRYDSAGLEISGFEACNGLQSILLDGIISHDPKDKLIVYLDGFELSNVNPFLASSNIAFGGVITGGGYVSNVLEDIYFETDLDVSHFLLNEYYVGDIELRNAWDNSEKRMSFDGGLREYLTRTVRFGGDYFVELEEDNLDLTLRLDDANLDWLGGILPEEVSNFQGLATGNLDVRGTFAKPEIDGRVKLYNAGVKVNMLNTYYRFGGNIIMDSQAEMIALDYIPIVDENGKQSYANATFFHDHFKDFNFDIYLEMDSMLALNTTKQMNDLYYGKALTSGFVNVYTGYLGDVVIDVNATSKKGTNVNLPLDGAQDVVLQDFVNFVDHDPLTIEETIDLTGVTMNFELDVTPDAKMRIIFDEAIGDIVEARGKGHISMMITTGGEFEMYGQYEITEGSYTFTYQNTFHKQFQVEPGGTVSWFGDPYEADLNLVAVYPLRATVADLVPSLSDKYKKPVDVEVQMHMTQSLFNPDIEFGIDLPSSDEGVNGQVDAAVNSTAEMNRQVFALIVLNQFLPPEGIGTTDHGSTNLASSGFAVINNQINDLMSQISDDFDIGINYTPGDELSSEEMAVALSTQMLDGKVEVSGNFGVSNAPTNAAGQDVSSVIGDVDIVYHVTDDGTFNIHAFNESNEFDVTNNQAARYTQGVGVYYEEEFNGLDELKVLQRFLNLFRKCENKKFRTKPCGKRDDEDEVTESN